MNANNSMMIMVAGPYFSPVKIKEMADMALIIYKLGHLPVLGEWFDHPLTQAAESKVIGNKPVYEILQLHPVAIRLIDHCDAVLRIGGNSDGADMIMETARSRGKLLFTHFEEIPVINH